VSQSEPRNEFEVHVHEGPHGWEVRIVDTHGVVGWTRPCADESQARIMASTVQQHIYWLSPAKFLSYYRLSEPA
jgi:hypothetical protein